MQRAYIPDSLDDGGEVRPDVAQDRVATTSTWCAPPRRPRLFPGQVHVWRARLDVAGDELATYRRTLDAEELARAGRFVRDLDRDRWVAARGFLRTVLGAYAGAAPATLRFRYGRYGKPALAGGGQNPGFNLAHSNEWALCAVAPARWVGVDIERVRVDLTLDETVGVLSPAERLEVAALEGDARAHTFFEKWTQKEALAKALGAGVSLPFDRIDVGSLTRPRETHVAGAWWLGRIAPAHGFEAAVAVEGERWSVRCWDGPPATESTRHSNGHGNRTGRSPSVSFGDLYNDPSPFGTGLPR